LLAPRLLVVAIFSFVRYRGTEWSWWRGSAGVMFVVALLALGVAMSVRRRREPMVIVAAARRRYEFLAYELLDRHKELL
jgi:uncharacterized protein (TIGR03382 family)